MNGIKRYKLCFDPWGLTLFLLVMLPNVYWFAFPAPNDLLRQDSVTPVLDSIASIAQVLLIAAICLLTNRGAPSKRLRPFFLGAAFCCGIYYVSWIDYYHGVTNAAVILSLCLFPCAAFFSYEAARKNYPAMIPTAVFTVCHLLYGTVNFII